MILKAGAIGLGLALSSAALSGAMAADLTITVDHLRNDQGQLYFCIFSAETSEAAVFPDCEKGRPVKSGHAIISGGKVVLTYNGLKDGTYAVAVIHDENGNGQLDTNFIGIPTEGLGISNNPSLLGKPKFDEAKFQLSGKMAITIEAKYIL